MLANTFPESVFGPEFILESFILLLQSVLTMIFLHIMK
jgi:hypothetical protein